MTTAGASTRRSSLPGDVGSPKTRNDQSWSVPAASMPCQHGVPHCRVQMKRRLYVGPVFFFMRTTGIMPDGRFRRPRLCTLHPHASRNGWSNARNLIPSDPAGPHKSAARHARLPAKRHISIAALEQARGARPRCIRTQPRTACSRSCTRRPVSCVQAVDRTAWGC